MENTVIQISPLDNVGIVCNAFGLQKGAIVLDNIVLLQDIPMGHKVALLDISEGKSIIRYGQIIGFANTTIQQGEWVDERKMTLPQAPNLEEIQYTKSPLTPDGGILEGYTFEGFRNADGSVGTKNLLGITTSVQCVAGITQYITQKNQARITVQIP